jgi:hypothetical protein
MFRRTFRGVLTALKCRAVEMPDIDDPMFETARRLRNSAALARAGSSVVEHSTFNRMAVSSILTRDTIPSAIASAHGFVD